MKMRYEMDKDGFEEKLDTHKIKVRSTQKIKATAKSYLKGFLEDR